MFNNILKTNKKSQKNNVDIISNFNKKTKEKSRGRSMVEMLGVLAIIGVLSIGGIQGYTIAMRKYRANEILASLQKYAFVLYQRCQRSVDEHPDEIFEREKNDQIVQEWSCYDLDGGSYNEIYDEPFPFSRAGIGAQPNDILLIYFSSDVFETGTAGAMYPVITTNSGDIVRFYVTFKNKEICQSVLNIVGTNMSATAGVCEEKNVVNSDELGYIGLVSFIMN